MEKYQNFLTFLESELNLYKNEIDEVVTIYLGGGTPNACTPRELESLLKLISEFVPLESIQEYTIECNPDSWNREHLRLFKKYGVTRISLGIQTTNDALNYSCNRYQTLEMVEESIRDLKEENYFNISFDFILNLFDQKFKDIDSDIKFIKKHLPDHISWYSLILKDGTPLKQLKKFLPENDYDYSIKVENELKKLNYQKYEISSYCRNNKRSIHNIGYWTTNLYLGIGWGAASLLYNQEEKCHYRMRVAGKLESPEKEIENLDERKLYFQVLLMGLRLTEGIDLKKDLFYNAYLFYENKLENLIKEEKLIISNNHLRTTNKGSLFLDDVLLEVI